jgi:DNA polymerase-1
VKTLTIIDTFGFLFRSFFALPPLKNKEGFPTGLLTGFANFIAGIEREHLTDYLVFALDSEGKSFRSEIDANYKAHRKEVPEDLLKQLPIAVSWIEQMGLSSCAKAGYEADDVIATIAKKAQKEGYNVKIVSHDKDLYQLIGDRIHMYDPIKRVDIDANACYEKYGVKPEEFKDYQALVGDSADNVPGVKGIGAKTAQKLIEQFHTLENIYENLDIAGTPRTKKLLSEGKESAFISKELVTLKDDIAIDYDICDFVLVENPLQKIETQLHKYELNRVLNRLNQNEKEQKQAMEFDAILLDTKEKLDNVLQNLSSQTPVAFDTETTAIDAHEAKLVGFSFCYEQNKAYYVPVAHSYLGVGNQVSLDDAIGAIKKIFTAKVIGQNIKYDLKVLDKYGIKLENIEADTMVLSWLLNPALKHGLDAMAQRFFHYETTPFSALVKKGETFDSVEVGKACFYASEDAWMTFHLYHKLKNLLEKELLVLAKEVENPFINVLLGMELAGIEVDTARLNDLENFCAQKLKELTQTIYDLAGSEFNIKSTQQLGHVLFETLGLQGGKKTKTGYSTNEEVLHSLQNEHPIIDSILQYREVQKIASTYVKPLQNYQKDSRVYTNFMHTGTATGRLSSNNPNLQNIPTRSKLGKRVRECFVPKQGYSFIGIDYSQIELRLLAHFSGDAALVAAFNNDEDIHLATAKKLFGDKAQEKRNFAKSINFGLIYGMGSRKLAQELGITTKEAKEIIQEYFAAFSSVKGYLASIERQAQAQGYSQTLLGRKRYFDFANANAFLQSTYLREAVNTVFQGSAADLMKLAMNSIYKTLQNDDEAIMLLQIHDELIFEVKDEAVAKYAKTLQETMESIYTLKIPLKTSVSIGKSWGDLK